MKRYGVNKSSSCAARPLPESVGDPRNPVLLLDTILEQQPAESTGLLVSFHGHRQDTVEVYLPTEEAAQIHNVRGLSHDGCDDQSKSSYRAGGLTTEFGGFVKVSSPRIRARKLASSCQLHRCVDGDVSH